MRLSLIALLPVAALAGCMSVKTFDDATKDVNEGFALGKQLRDRCNATQDIDHCRVWVEYKRSEEAQNEFLDYDKGLARWEAKGPY